MKYKFLHLKTETKLPLLSVMPRHISVKHLYKDVEKSDNNLTINTFILIILKNNQQKKLSLISISIWIQINKAFIQLNCIYIYISVVHNPRLYAWINIFPTCLSNNPYAFTPTFPSPEKSAVTGYVILGSAPFMKFFIIHRKIQ